MSDMILRDLIFRIFLGTLAVSVPAWGEDLNLVTPLTEEGAFTAGIEGPACDKSGTLYAVSYLDKGNIGAMTPSGQTSLFVTLPAGSTGNGICFDRAGTMFVADYTGHNILRIDPATKAISVHAHEPKMNQPNDITISFDGTLYASDPNWKDGTGQLWRIDRDGTVTLLAAEHGTTNGIELSPDGKTLYVNESVQRKVWAYTVTGERTLTDKRLLKEFPDHGFDGMRCDVDGNLYITRHGKGTVVKLSPGGEILREIVLPGSMPSNLCFGGPDGKTIYVTEVQHKRILSFRADRPGLAWQRWQEAPTQGAVKSQTRDLFIVAGQSNAVGFDANPAELPADNNDARVKFWYRAGDPPPDEHDTTSAGKWTALGPMPRGNPMPKDQGVPRQYGNFSNPSGGFGPEIAFVRTLLAKQPDQSISAIKAAFSGTNLGSDWDPDDPGAKGACYRALINELQLAEAAAKAEGITLQPRALIWVQGESDANSKDVTLYTTRLTHFVNALRKHLKTPELTALVGVNTQFGLGKNPHMPGIVKAQQAAAAADPRIIYVDTASAPVINSAHFSTRGTLDVGRMFAEAWLGCTTK